VGRTHVGDVFSTIAMRLLYAFAFLALLLAPPAHAQWSNVGPGRFDNAAFVSDGSTTYARVWAGNAAARPTQVLYRSDDGGRRWTEIARAGMALASANTFANPVLSMDAKGGRVGVLTSDNAGSRSTVAIYTSADGGTTWTRSPRVITGAEEAEHLVVVSGATLVTYFRRNHQNAVPVVHVSTDAGATWTAQTVDASAFVGQSTTNRIHTAAGALFVPLAGTGTLVSRDLGASWTRAGNTAGGTAAWTEGERYYVHLAATGARPNSSLHWTDDGGQSWQQKTINLAGGASGAGFTDKMRSKGDTLLYPTPATTLDLPGIRYSTSFGDAFEQGDADSVVARAGSGLTAGTRHVVHATQAGFLYAPLQQAGARIYFSADGGKTWEPTNARGHEEDTPPMQMLPGGVLVAPLADREGYYRSTNGGETWRYISAIDASFNDDGLMTTQLGALFAYCRDEVYRSDDALYWSKVGENVRGQGGMDFFFSDDDALYAIDLRRSVSSDGGTDATLYRSTDSGQSWSVGATGLSITGTPSASAGRVVAAFWRNFQGSDVRVSTDLGDTFTTTALPLAGVADAAATPGALFVSGGREGSVFGPAASYLYRSTDDGTSWTNLAGQGTIFTQPILSVHRAGGLVVAVKSDTVSVSGDEGDSWTRIGAFPAQDYGGQRGVQALVSADDLFVQVVGANQVHSGLWRTSLSGTGIVVSGARAAVLPEASLSLRPSVTRSETTVRFRLEVGGAVRIEAFDALGRRVAVLADAAYRAGDQQVAWDASRLAPGGYFVRLITPDRSVVRQLIRL
jgi:hypothetical protein